MTQNVIIASFVDDAASLAVGKSNEDAAAKLQIAVDYIKNWVKSWQIKLKEYIVLYKQTLKTG